MLWTPRNRHRESPSVDESYFRLGGTQRVSFLVHSRGGWDGGSWGVDLVMRWWHRLSTFSDWRSDGGEGWRLLRGESTMVQERGRNLGGKRRELVDGDRAVPSSSESSRAGVLDWVTP